MKSATTLAAVQASLAAAVVLAALASAAPPAHAGEWIPDWIKTNAGWWAEGAIDDGTFVRGIEYMVGEGIIRVPPPEAASAPGQGGTAAAAADPPGDGAVPAWIKSSAGWWAAGAISDGEFVNGISYLMAAGVISVPAGGGAQDRDPAGEPQAADPGMAALEAELEECAGIAKPYNRLECEKPIKKEMLLRDYQANAMRFDLGPVSYYWFGVGSEGNEFEITPTGQALLSVRMLAENTGDGRASLDCTSPSICSYDVWDGTRSFKYSGMDFTSGQIVLNPGDSREFNILFGPNIGYGGTQFEYDPSRTYHFRINEDFGSVEIALDLE